MTPFHIALLIVWGTLLFGGFIVGKPDAVGRRIPRLARIFSSLVLVIAAWWWAVLARGSAVETYSALIFVGMICGFAGDLALLEGHSSRRDVLAGIAAFGLGHALYIAAALDLANRLGLTADAPRWGALIALWAVALICWYGVVYRGAREKSALQWASLPYALLLASTAGLGLGMALQNTAFIGLALGGLLFLISDLILAAQMFSGARFPLIGDVIWLTYGPAQLLIVWSVGAALMGV